MIFSNPALSLVRPVVTPDVFISVIVYSTNWICFPHESCLWNNGYVSVHIQQGMGVCVCMQRVCWHATCVCVDIQRVLAWRYVSVFYVSHVCLRYWFESGHFSRPSLWHKAKRIVLTAGQTEVKVGQSVTCGQSHSHSTACWNRMDPHNLGHP